MEKKLDESNSTKKPSEKVSVDYIVIVEKHDTQFKCEECEYSTSSSKGLQIHIEKNTRLQGKLMVKMTLI